jgi:signal transduction histidine kinase
MIAAGNAMSERWIGRLSLLAAMLLAAFPSWAAARGDLPLGPQPVAGWPVILGNGIHGSAAVADLDGDGRDELAVGVRDGRVFLLDATGRVLPGWPQQVSGNVFRTPLLCDLDGDGEREVLVAGHDALVHAWRADGTPLAGWPVEISDLPVSTVCELRSPAGIPFLLIACRDGRIHLLDERGRPRSPWPLQGKPPVYDREDLSQLTTGDLDRDGTSEVLLLAQADALLQVWTIDGRPVPGFPHAIGGRGVGVSCLDTPAGVRIACTTRDEIILLNADGIELWRERLPDREDRYASGPFLVPGGRDIGPGSIFAATQAGRVCLWDLAGNPLPGWPRTLGGFIFGLSGQEELRGISGPPALLDVDGDGARELLIASQDQHLYCLSLAGELLPGWPVTLDDGAVAGPVLAELDGEEPPEVIVGQVGETLFAFHVRPPSGVGTEVGPPDLLDTGSWPRRRAGVIACLVLLGLLLVLVSPLDRREGLMPTARRRLDRVLLGLVLTLLGLRALLLVDQILQYRRNLADLDERMDEVARLVVEDRRQVTALASTLAAELAPSWRTSRQDPVQLLYCLERLADRHRLDYRNHGLMVTDGAGRALQAVGLARGWPDRRSLGLDGASPARPCLLDGRPVHVGEATLDGVALGGPAAGKSDTASTAVTKGRLLLLRELSYQLPRELADASGAAVHLRLGGRTIAYGGGANHDHGPPWPWLGHVEPFRTLPLLQGGEPPLTVRLAFEDQRFLAAGWLDLLLAILLPLLYYRRVLRGLVPDRRRGRWWPFAFLAVCLLAGLLLYGGVIMQRPVPATAHLLEVILALTAMLGVATAIRIALGSRRAQRLDFALLGSYLLVALLPCGVLLLITTGLVQETQRRLARDTLTDLERRADNLVMGYLGDWKFPARLWRASRTLLDEPPETAWFDFAKQNHLLFTYDLPTAYVTLWCRARDDPSRSFTGFTYRAPRTEKLSARWPDWIGSGPERGLFLDGDLTLVRALRPLRFKGLDAQMTSHIPLDRQFLTRLEERLRILPFLPRVRLRPAWATASPERGSRGGMRLPLETRIALPARDWATGHPHWLLFRAQALLPRDREMEPVLAFLMLLTLLPLGLSAWGAWWTYRRTVRPLRTLLGGIRRVETGDLDYRLEHRGRSEVATSARAFDRMAESLQSTVREVAEKQKLQEISDLKSRFISMVSHDLKTPLAAIQGAAENVLGELAGPLTMRQRRYLEMILRSSEDLQVMIGNLLDLSRLESGRLELVPEILDLRREAEAVLRAVRPLLEQRRLTARLVVESKRTRVKADRTRLWQVLSNLVGNAIQHSPPDGDVTVRLSDRPAAGAQAQMLQVAVEDAGPGVPPEMRGRIFEPFVTGQNESTRARRAGLGLAIVRQLVHLHGGEVWVEDRPQGGARFTFTMPCDEVCRSYAEPRDSCAPPQAGDAAPDVTGGTGME